MKKTKIIATVWPVTESEENLIQMYNSWVNIVRFNFSHATFAWAKPIADRIKKLNFEWKTNLSLLLDTKWPEIRTGVLKEKLKFSCWEKVKIFVDDSKREWNGIFCDYEYLIEDLNIWDIFIIDSWLCRVKVLEKYQDYLLVEMLNSCEIGNKRHINLPWVRLKLPGITEKDREDVLFAIENNYDFIAMSFVRNKENIAELRDLLASKNASHIKIISKIENQEAIENLEEIVKNSDGVMVARWDLWIEVPIEKLPFYQKQIVDLCLKNGKFCIIATHLLETMIENPFPTRAEVSDIYNSVLASTDCTMLSWETTTWKYPMESIQMMNAVIQEAEKSLVNTHNDFSNGCLTLRDREKKSLIKHSLMIADELQAQAIIIMTKAGILARLAAAFRPNINIYAFTKNRTTFNFMNILYWVKPFLLEDWSNDCELNLEKALYWMRQDWTLTIGNRVIVISDIQKNGKKIPIIEIIDIE